jgi:hypothetical protein
MMVNELESLLMAGSLARLKVLAVTRAFQLLARAVSAGTVHEYVIEPCA